MVKKQGDVNLKTTIPDKDNARSKATEECDLLQLFMWHHNIDARRTREIKSKIAMVQAAFNKKAIFASQLDLNLRKKLVKWYLEHFFYLTES